MILSINVILICITLFIVIFSVVLSQNNRSICMPHGNLTQTDKTLNTLDRKILKALIMNDGNGQSGLYVWFEVTKFSNQRTVFCSKCNLHS